MKRGLWVERDVFLLLASLVDANEGGVVGLNGDVDHDWSFLQFGKVGAGDESDDIVGKGRVDLSNVKYLHLSR